MSAENTPKTFMGWQEIDSAIDMGQSAINAVKHFQEKYHMDVKYIACHPDVLELVRSTCPGSEVYADPYVFTTKHLHLYGDTDAKHNEGEHDGIDTE